MSRRSSALVVAPVLILFLASALIAAQAKPRAFRVADDLLMPNLVTLQPTGLRIVSPGSQRLLRLSNTIANVGVGPVELQPRRRDCNGDGDLANDRTAIQRIFHDINGDGIYERRVDVSFAPRIAGCFEYSVTHGHWHFHDYASYELRDPLTDTVVASTAKVGFCLLDTLHPYPGVPGSPERRHYRSCERDSVQGSSVGYADFYQWYLPGQWIDVAGVPDGAYCLVTTADPAAQLSESDETDNAYRQSIELRGDAVLPLATAC